MVAWFAELFYIFRLFVYHTKHQANPELCKVFEIMEHKLIYFIGHPAMLFTIIFGITMIFKNPSLWQEKWLHAKLGLVVLLMGYQFFSGFVRRKMAKRDFFLSEKACRIINEVPALLLIAIVFLVMLKPF